MGLERARIAIVHDWLVTYAGAERVLEEIVDLFPTADLFSLIDFLPKEQRRFIKEKSVNTSFLQKVPYAKKKYRNLLPLMPFAVEQFDLSRYDVVISSSYAVAKGVITGPDQLHISYVHSPVRYAWDLQHQYLSESGLEKGFRGALVRMMLHKLRIWDVRTANSVDKYVANSHFIARRIWKTYRRKAVVIYPPVNVEKFTLSRGKEDFYLAASRLVPYKKVSLIVKAFAAMPNKRLVVLGEGPEYKSIKAISGSNVEVLGYQPFDVLKKYMQSARAYIFAAEEDFGIMPVEVQACGTPVIAYGKGGVCETVIPGKTGVFFYRQKEEAIIEAVKEFETMNFDKYYIRRNAEKFSTVRFKKDFKKHVEHAYQTFEEDRRFWFDNST